MRFQWNDKDIAYHRVHSILVYLNEENRYFFTSKKCPRKQQIPYNTHEYALPITAFPMLLCDCFESRTPAFIYTHY
jgi:hypothetical protein